MTDDPDLSEAHRRRYGETGLRIAALSSGRYALYFPFTEVATPLCRIGEWAELESSVRDYITYREPAATAERREQDAINLEELFGPGNQAENSCGN